MSVSLLATGMRVHLRYFMIVVLLTTLHWTGEIKACEPPMDFAAPAPPPLNQQIRRAHHQANQIVEGTVYAMPDRATTGMMYIVVDQYFKGSGISVLMVADENNPCAGPALWHQDHAVFFLRGQSLINRFEATDQVAAAIQNRTGQQPLTLPHLAPGPLVLLFGLVTIFPAIGMLGRCYGLNRRR